MVRGYPYRPIELNKIATTPRWVVFEREIYIAVTEGAGTELVWSELFIAGIIDGAYVNPGKNERKSNNPR